MNKNFVITSSFDRTVYPINGIMHLRVNTPEILPNEQIFLKILDYKNNVLFQRKVNPKKMKNLFGKDSDGGLFQIDFPMKGRDWKIGEEYTLWVKYGESETYSTTIIAKRKSIILTDRTSYNLGSDAIITIIAPDFDLDNEKPDVIGNTSKNNVTISTSHGKLSKYKLRETGHSTGIFQGVVGFLPGKYVEGGRKIIWSKPKGKGPADGYIPAEIGDRITITFKNPYETVTGVAYIEHYGNEISLDKETYAPNERMKITVKAPHYNFSSNKIDSIGYMVDNKMNISSIVDRISKFKLKETGKNTGIFTGQVVLKYLELSKKLDRLTLRNMSIKKSSKNILYVTTNDKITVSFITKDGQYKRYAEILG